jgi:hypothetical protein
MYETCSCQTFHLWAPVPCRVGCIVLQVGPTARACSPAYPTRQNGVTPLYLASENGHAEVVERLTAAGADTSAKINVSVSVWLLSAILAALSACCYFAACYLFRWSFLSEMLDHGRRIGVDTRLQWMEQLIYDAVKKNWLSKYYWDTA